MLAPVWRRLAAPAGAGRPLRSAIQNVSEVLFSIIGIVMRLAPIGAFGAIAFTTGKYGIASLLSLGRLLATFYAACLFFIFAVLGTIARVHGFSIWKLVKYLRRELLIVLGTCSSESVLPQLMTRLETLGADRSIVGLVIPTGYSFNLDGTAIYLTMAAVFLAQATATPLPLSEQIALLALLLIASKGAAAVTGSAFIVLAGTLSTLGHIPVAGLALILGVDRFMSEARAVTNAIGNSVATLIVAKWNGALDMKRLHCELNGSPVLEPRAPAVALELREGGEVESVS